MKNRTGVNTGISDSADKADIKQKSSTRIVLMQQY